MLSEADKTYIKKQLEEQIYKLKKELKSKFTAGFDQIMFELKAIREEQTIGAYRRRENSDLLENHEERISRVELRMGLD